MDEIQEETQGRLTCKQTASGIGAVYSDTDLISRMAGVAKYIDAKRLTACWNACIGIPTELLETADPERQPAIYSVQAKRIAQLELQVTALKGGEVADLMDKTGRRF